MKTTTFTAIILTVVLSIANIRSVAQQKTNAATEKKINALIKKLTLEEKISMIHANTSFTTAGVKRLGIPGFTMLDGPHGVHPEPGNTNVNDSSTYLPVGISLASTWNPDLAYKFGAVLGSEAKYRGKDIILGPGINIMRTPLNGRNFEYMSEDPYLIAKMVTGSIKGIQDQGISACVKHFMGNNQETRRDGINVEMSERALREIYLPGFKAAVEQGGVNCIMGAYNKFRGQYCSYNDYLVNKILKQEWGFKGLVMSDWAATHETKAALLGGEDLEMGSDYLKPKREFNNFYFAALALVAIKNGEIKESIIDDKVRRILRVMYKTHMFDKRTPGSYATREHAEIALKVAEEGIILLKNQDAILPLKKSSLNRIAVIGFNAIREQAMGGGSSKVRAKYEITPLKGLQNLAGSQISISYSKGYDIARNAQANEKLISEAKNEAANADVAIVVGGWTHGYNYDVWEDNAYDGEEYDKPDMHLPFGQDELIQEVLKANKNTIIVFFGGGPIDVSKWIDQAKAVLQIGYPGQEGGNALAKILFGKVNPSGKLTVTWPRKLEDAPAHKLGEYPGDGTSIHYKDDIYVGYRYFDTFNVKPQYAFGFGLSYTEFKYDNMVISKKGDTVLVKIGLKNTGKVAGSEVAELYVSQEKSALARPQKELKSFKKVFLKPGERQIVSFKLPVSAFQYYNDLKSTWVLERGLFNVLVGSSSDHILLEKSVRL